MVPGVAGVEAKASIPVSMASVSHTLLVPIALSYGLLFRCLQRERTLPAKTFYKWSPTLVQCLFGSKHIVKTSQNQSLCGLKEPPAPLFAVQGHSPGFSFSAILKSFVPPVFVLRKLFLGTFVLAHFMPT